ncbi:hypothetical protein Pelo_4601 [Pelomyxa schiedti]|nr:hypothetical protein Pelo_4601 [Pelomyxa schiedti]
MTADIAANPSTMAVELSSRLELMTAQITAHTKDSASLANLVGQVTRDAMECDSLRRDNEALRRESQALRRELDQLRESALREANALDLVMARYREHAAIASSRERHLASSLRLAEAALARSEREAAALRAELARARDVMLHAAELHAQQLQDCASATDRLLYENQVLLGPQPQQQQLPPPPPPPQQQQGGSIAAAASQGLPLPAPALASSASSSPSTMSSSMLASSTPSGPMSSSLLVASSPSSPMTQLVQAECDATPG